MGLRLLCAALCFTLPQVGAAEQLWDLKEQRILASHNDQNSIGRLEVMASENCTAIELRLWAEVSDIDMMDLTNGGTIPLRFLIADMQISSEGHLIETYQGVSENRHLVYFRLGYWAWNVLDYLPDQEHGTHFSLLADGYVLASNNTWPVGDLSDQLTKLKRNCDRVLKGTML